MAEKQFQCHALALFVFHIIPPSFSLQLSSLQFIQLSFRSGRAAFLEDPEAKHNAEISFESKC